MMTPSGGVSSATDGSGVRRRAVGAPRSPPLRSARSNNREIDSRLHSTAVDLFSALCFPPPFSVLAGSLQVTRAFFCRLGVFFTLPFSFGRLGALALQSLTLQLFPLFAFSLNALGFNSIVFVFFSLVLQPVYSGQGCFSRRFVSPYQRFGDAGRKCRSLLKYLQRLLAGAHFGLYLGPAKLFFDLPGAQPSSLTLDLAA
jgi:hypothetical protein